MPQCSASPNRAAPCWCRPTYWKKSSFWRDRIVLMVSGKLAAAGDIRAIREKLDEQAYHVRIVTDSPRPLAAALINLEEVDSVNLGPDRRTGCAEPERRCAAGGNPPPGPGVGGATPTG